MKNIYRSIIFIAAAIVAASCAKVVIENSNDADQRYFKAWLIENGYSDLKPLWNGVELSKEDADKYNGIYQISNDEGTGTAVTKDGFAIMEFTAYDLEGNITEYTDSVTAVQLGEYDPSAYYGPEVWLTYDEAIPAGVLNALIGMKTGGSKKVIIPSWFMTYSVLDSPKDYFEKKSDMTHSIYEFTVKGFTTDISKWEIESIGNHIIKEFGSLNAFSNDTTGFYFRNRKPYSSNAVEFPKDTTIYINYTGKLLNGLVFDTTVEKTAKDNNIYSSSREYAPVMIKFGATNGEIKMGSDETEVIPGFSRTISKMKYNPKEPNWKDSVIGIFESSQGYGYAGSGASIPAYAPLIFEIEVVDKPAE